MTTYTINNSRVTQTTGFTPSGTLKGGDTLIIPNGWTNHLYIRDVIGASGNPITITNPSNAKISITEVMIDKSPFGSISIINSRYIVLDGSNDSSEIYGISVANGHYGIRLYQSEDIEMKYIEIMDTKYPGIQWQKGTWPASQDVENMIVHNCYIHDTGTEGIYLGSSNFDPALFPSFKDCKIYSNVVKDTGWDGIQLCGGDEGVNEIYDNHLNGCGHLDSAQHCHGIFLDYVIGSIYNNLVIGTYCDGIYINWTSPGADVHDNVFVRSGRHGINNNSNEVGQKIINNTTIDSNYRAKGGYGIRTTSDRDRGEIRYNLVVGTATAGQIRTSYSVNKNNIESNSISDQYFKDVNNDDYRLTSISPARDYNNDIGYSLIDFYGNTRPFGIKADAGAIEYIGVSDPCEGVVCDNICIGKDLWSQRCDPGTGNCIPDQLLESNSATCGYDPCEGVVCDNICIGLDLWSQNCVDGSCVPDQLLESNSVTCGYDPCEGVVCDNICIGKDLWSQKCEGGSCVPDQLLESNSVTCELCEGVVCGNTCVGDDLWSQRCDPDTGNCVPNQLLQQDSINCEIPDQVPSDESTIKTYIILGGFGLMGLAMLILNKK